MTGAGTPSSMIEAACTDYYFLTSKKTQKLYPFPAFSPSLPPFPSLVQLSGQWDRGKEPSMYSQTSPPLPSPSSPIQTASCSAVPLAAGSSQVRCSTQATTCSLLTAVLPRLPVNAAGPTIRARERYNKGNDFGITAPNPFHWSSN